MKIGITGTYSTGKSTLIQSLTQVMDEYGSDYGITTVSGIASRCPFPLNKDQTLEGTLWILNEVVNMELVFQDAYEVTIADRTVIDVWAMGRWAWQNRRGTPILEKLITQITATWAPTYDIIFRTKIDTLREPNWPKIPDRDLEFRTLVDALQEACVETFGLDVIELPHDKKERVSTILKHIGLNAPTTD